jgi:hypothetical protein
MSDARHQIAERWRWRVPAEHRDRDGQDGHAGNRGPPAHAAHDRLAHGALARAFGHDRREARVGGSGLDELLAAYEKAQPLDAPVAHVGLLPEEVEAGLDIRDRPPAAGVGVAFAVAVAARVEQPYHDGARVSAVTTAARWTSRPARLLP